ANLAALHIRQAVGQHAHTPRSMELSENRAGGLGQMNPRLVFAYDAHERRNRGDGKAEAPAEDLEFPPALAGLTGAPEQVDNGLGVDAVLGFEPACRGDKSALDEPFERIQRVIEIENDGARITHGVASRSQPPAPSLYLWAFPQDS